MTTTTTSKALVGLISSLTELLKEDMMGLEKVSLTETMVYPYIIRNISRGKAYVGFAGTPELREEYALAVKNKTFSSNTALFEDIKAQRAEDFTFTALDPVDRDEVNTTRGAHIVHLQAEGFTPYNVRNRKKSATINLRKQTI